MDDDDDGDRGELLMLAPTVAPVPGELPELVGAAPLVAWLLTGLIRISGVGPKGSEGGGDGKGRHTMHA